MDSRKIQTIEKLLFLVVTISYLLIPLGFLLSKAKISQRIAVALGLYGLLVFGFLLSYRFFPKDKEFRKFVQLAYTLFEYLFFAFIFWSNIKNRKFRLTMILLSAGFLVFQVVYFLTSTLVRLDSIPIGIETILILIYISYFFYESFKRTTNFYIYNHYCFWLSVGILIYLGGSFFFYILINNLTDDQIETFGNLTYVAEIIKNVLFMTSLFILNRYPPIKTDEKTNVPFLDII